MPRDASLADSYISLLAVVMVALSVRCDILRRRPSLEAWKYHRYFPHVMDKIVWIFINNIRTRVVSWMNEIWISWLLQYIMLLCLCCLVYYDSFTIGPTIRGFTSFPIISQYLYNSSWFKWIPSSSYRSRLSRQYGPPTIIKWSFRSSLLRKV